MKLKLKLLSTAAAWALMLVISVLGQQPSSYVSAGAVFSDASRLSYNGIGKGTFINAGIRVPGKLYLTGEFRYLSERKTFAEEGRSFVGAGGVNYYLSSIKGAFVRAGYRVSNHTNEQYSKTGHYFEYGGGYNILNKTTGMPAFEASAVGMAPLDADANPVFKLSTKTYYTFGYSPFGVVGTAEISRQSGRYYGNIGGGLFINLSAISGQ